MFRCLIGSLVVLHVIWVPTYAFIWFVLADSGDGWSFIAAGITMVVWVWSYFRFDTWHKNTDYYPKYEIVPQVVWFFGPALMVFLLTSVYFPSYF